MIFENANIDNEIALIVNINIEDEGEINKEIADIADFDEGGYAGIDGYAADFGGDDGGGDGGDDGGDGGGDGGGGGGDWIYTYI